MKLQMRRQERIKNSKHALQDRLGAHSEAHRQRLRRITGHPLSGAERFNVLLLKVRRVRGRFVDSEKSFMNILTKNDHFLSNWGAFWCACWRSLGSLWIVWSVVGPLDADWGPEICQETPKAPKRTPKWWGRCQKLAPIGAKIGPKRRLEREEPNTSKMTTVSIENVDFGRVKGQKLKEQWSKIGLRSAVSSI